MKGDRILLTTPQELHHVRDVLRLKPGDPINCFDGKGTEQLGRIYRTTSRGFEITIEGRRRADTPSVSLWLVLALLKADRFDWALQKATELGVTRITPIVTERSIVRPPQDQRGHKQARWQRIAKEASKQCGRSIVPQIDAPVAFDQVMKSLNPQSLILIPTLSTTAVPLSTVVASTDHIRDATLLIGPEGDFSLKEVALAERYGARPVSLGALVLRAETAAIAGLAILRYLAGLV